ncbi:hypothetical protein FACS1894151_11720 [Spirochaetia bacterium]|nr:hypothetical protein FACS1894151_11720 [Spirochaetia bacterium]
MTVEPDPSVQTDTKKAPLKEKNTYNMKGYYAPKKIKIARNVLAQDNSFSIENLAEIFEVSTEEIE